MTTGFILMTYERKFNKIGDIKMELPGYHVLNIC